MPTPTLATKPHYPILDGLRGVAALMVVAFHLLEAHASSHQTQLINHGYLAVDFFFLLSGFVIGYAYDDRWGRMSLGDFVKRRLVRLQPMVAFGAVVGAALFYFGACPQMGLIAHTPGWQVALYTLLGALMLPVTPGLDIRGWSETYPLNGPAWSLFFEYLGNLLYALLVWRFPRWLLAVLVALSAAALLRLLLTRPEGDIVGGWALDATQFPIGLTRLMFPFFGGLLLFRTVRPGRVSGAFLLSSLLLVAALAWPRVGSEARPWLNGLYEAGCIIALFPLVVYLAASGSLVSEGSRRLCGWLGDISYPIYITHYPLIYVYTAWVYTHQVPVREGLPWAALTFAAAVALAWVGFKFYDEPVRRWLGRRVLGTGQQPAPSVAAAPERA